MANPTSRPIQNSLDFGPPADGNASPYPWHHYEVRARAEINALIEEMQLDAADRTAVAQRGRVHVQLVLVGARVQADVADGEERSLEPILEVAGTRHHREIHPGLLPFSEVQHLQVG